MSKASRYWDTIALGWVDRESQALWRMHADEANSALLTRWLPTNGVERLLKTDSFDEAVGCGLYPCLSAAARHIFGMDVSFEAVHAAKGRYGKLQAMEADVRHLPLADDVLDMIVSNSTLDHFSSRADISIGLQQLYRVLRPGGQLLITLDNLGNPAIALRNRLPLPWLHWLGIVRYQVGVSLTPRGLEQALRAVGFDVLELTTLMHHPSVAAVALARMLQRRASPAVQRRYMRLLMDLECLSDCPTRFLTAHFVAVRAGKPER